jgi:spore coat protein JC
LHSFYFLAVNKGVSADFAKWNISDAFPGTEELAHLEMVATIVHQLTRNLSMEEIEASGFQNYYVDHTVGIWPQAAGGIPFNACEFQSKGDIITDLHENMAAEQKARSTYDNILRLIHDNDVCEPIRFLREREIVHYQRFGEAKRSYTNITFINSDIPYNFNIFVNINYFD